MKLPRWQRISPPPLFIHAACLPEGQEWCRVCREVTRFEELPGYATAPDFRCCQMCGDGYCITPEKPREEAS